MWKVLAAHIHNQPLFRMSKVERFCTVGRLGGPRAWARGQLERGGERSGGAAAAYSLLRCAALCGRETIETFAGQMQLARR